MTVRPAWWNLESFQAGWGFVRDVILFGLGARWGEQLMTSEGQADPIKWAAVGYMLGLPLVLHHDRQRRKEQVARPTTANGDGSMDTAGEPAQP